MESLHVSFWGPPTSYLNFCEEDFVITRFVGEFINTLSSLVFVGYGIYGLLQLHRKKQTGYRSISYLGLIGVGVCSASYHMTLKYHTQMSDELSMHLLTTPLLYRILTFQASPQRTKIVGIVLSTLFTIVMVTHMVMDEFLLHATTFGLAVYLIATRMLKIIPDQVPDPKIRRTLRNLTFFGCFSFVFGYFVWLIDDWACGLLTQTRHAVGVPLAFLFELHGWWHVFTAIGGYVAVALVDMITSGEVNENPTGDFAWPLAPAAKIIDRLTAPTKKD
ncbi:alkaline phytoceramidase [Penicillium paradoxum]|uniref:alkaline phytoceramidase n=1 Tax=Penicillium paradoxum TaxID=176176 RepID=UPI0025468BE2|nr:alkaline phytoceramidase [Penicillium paradoxum]KAJ5772978.1 alkaline phytoceramidase [Penicillium paradoxum]